MFGYADKLLLLHKHEGGRHTIRPPCAGTRLKARENERVNWVRRRPAVRFVDAT